MRETDVCRFYITIYENRDTALESKNWKDGDEKNWWHGRKDEQYDRDKKQGKPIYCSEREHQILRQEMVSLTTNMSGKVNEKSVI